MIRHNYACPCSITTIYYCVDSSTIFLFPFYHKVRHIHYMSWCPNHYLQVMTFTTCWMIRFSPFLIRGMVPFHFPSALCWTCSLFHQIYLIHPPKRLIYANISLHNNIPPDVHIHPIQIPTSIEWRMYTIKRNVILAPPLLKPAARLIRMEGGKIIAALYVDHFIIQHGLLLQWRSRINTIDKKLEK